MPSMRILKEKEVRRRPVAERLTKSVNALSTEEQAHVAQGLRVLKVRLGTWKEVAAALGVSLQVTEKGATGKWAISAGMALRVARLAGVPVEDVLSGAFPKPGSCPMCGRGGE